MKFLALIFATVLCSSLGAADTFRVLCYGDSITAAQDGWVSRLGASEYTETLNAGVGGRRAANAPKEFAPYLVKYESERVDLIIMCLGVNDLPARDPRPGAEKVTLCVRGMKEAIELARSRFPTTEIVLLAPSGVNPSTMSEVNLAKGYQITQPLLEDLEVAYRKLAEEMGVSFFSLLGVVSSENYLDGLHPNGDGHEQIAAAVRGYLVGRGLVRDSTD